MKPPILALDLSLTGTGLATYSTLQTLKPPKTAKDGMIRLDWILSEVKKNTMDLQPRLAIMEDLAFAARDTNHERAGLTYLIRYFLWCAKIPYVVVAPTSLKKFTTGSGKAEKSSMIMEVYKRWHVSPKNDNEADAYSLLRVGMILCGVTEAETKPQKEVIAVVSKNNQEAIKQCYSK